MLSWLAATAPVMCEVGDGHYGRQEGDYEEDIEVG